jgi:hypothetical protein
MSQKRLDYVYIIFHISISHLLRLIVVLINIYNI